MLTAIIVAAGNSQRMGFDKLFATIAGKPMIAHTLRAFERASSVNEIIIVAREDRHEEIRKISHAENFRKIPSIIVGGERRQDSVRAGLNRLNAAAKYVAVHDAARPLITSGQIERVFEQCRAHGAATLAEPINDTLNAARVIRSPRALTTSGRQSRSSWSPVRSTGINFTRCKRHKFSSAR